MSDATWKEPEVGFWHDPEKWTELVIPPVLAAVTNRYPVALITCAGPAAITSYNDGIAAGPLLVAPGGVINVRETVGGLGIVTVGGGVLRGVLAEDIELPDPLPTQEKATLNVGPPVILASGTLENFVVEGAGIQVLPGASGNIGNLEINQPIIFRPGASVLMSNDCILRSQADFLAAGTMLALLAAGDIVRVLTLAGGSALRGVGQITGGGRIVNGGDITAVLLPDAAEGTDTALLLHPGRLDNSGVLSAVAGTTLILSTDLVGVGGSRALAPEGATVLVNYGRVRGVNETGGTGFTFSPHWGNRLGPARIDGPITFGPGGFVLTDDADTPLDENAYVTLNGEAHFIGPGVEFRTGENPAGKRIIELTKGRGGIRGGGFVTGWATLVNHGRIRADSPAEPLVLKNNRVENRATGSIEAGGAGSGLEITTLLTGEPGSRIVAEPGAKVIVNAGRVRGDMTTEGSGLAFSPHWANRIGPARIDGPITLETSGQATVDEDSILSGRATLAGPGALLTIAGDGERPRVLRMPGGGISGVGGVNGPGTLVLEGASLVGVRPAGAEASATLNVSCARIENGGEITATSADVVLTTQITCHPASRTGVGMAWEWGADAIPPRVIINNGRLTGETITSVEPSGVGLTFTAHWANRMGDALIHGPLDLRQSGFLGIDGPTTWDGPARLDGGATITLGVPEVTLTLTEQGAIEGTGTVNGPGTLIINGTISANVLTLEPGRVENQGTLRASGPNAVLTINHHLQCHEAGRIIAENGGTIMVGIGRVSGVVHTAGKGLSFSAHWANRMGDATVHGPLDLSQNGFVGIDAPTIWDGPARLDSSLITLGIPEATLTLTEQGTIEGSGTVNGPSTLIMNGTITANVLTLDSDRVEHRGTLQAISPNAVLTINKHLQCHEPSRIVAENGGIVVVGIGRVSGVVHTSGDGLRFSGHWANRMSDAVIHGPLDLRQNGFLGIDGPTIWDGPVRLDGSGITLGTPEVTLTLTGQGVIEGRGNINGPGTLIVQGTINADVLTLEPGRVENRGTLRANGPNAVLTINHDLQCHESGRIVAEDGGTVIVGIGRVSGVIRTRGEGLRFSGHWANRMGEATIYGRLRLGSNGQALTEGDVTLGDGSEALFEGDGAGLNVWRKTLTVADGGTIRGWGGIVGESGSILVNHGRIVADQIGHVLSVRPGRIENNGRMEAENGAHLVVGFVTNTARVIVPADATLTLAGGMIQTGGETRVDGALSIPPGCTLTIQGGVLTGSGTINGSVVHAGGRIELSNSLLGLSGPFQQSGDAATSVVLNGAEPGDGYGSIAVAGAVALGGVLEVIVSEKYPPAIGTSFPILSHAPGQRTGEFRQIISRHPRIAFHAVTTDEGVQIVVEEARKRGVPISPRGTPA